MFELPQLPYSYDALEPFMDARTVEIHYSKHHATYTLNFNNAIKGTDLEGKTIEQIFEVIENYQPAVKNNAGGYVNHNLFWSILIPKEKSGAPSGVLLEAINKSFGSFDKFKEDFTKSALGRFGSGWSWLVVKRNGKLEICSTANQDNPMMKIGDCCVRYPILTIDVWEHAYYLHYQNRRADFISNFFNIINWRMVESLYADALAYYATHPDKNSDACKSGCCI